MRLTRKLRDEIASLLCAYDLCRGEQRDTRGQLLYDVRKIVATLEVEEEPVLLHEAMEAAKQAGWWIFGGGTKLHFIRGPEHFEMVTDDWDHSASTIVVSTRFAPPDLMDGRLAALDSEVKP